MSYSFVKTDGLFHVSPERSGLVAAKLKQFGYHWDFDADGGIEDVWPKGDNLTSDLELFQEIAPYVEEGGFLEFRGEDDSMWRWVFYDGECYEINAIITWPEILFDDEAISYPEMKNSDAMFESYQSEAGLCPVCGYDELDYGSFEVGDDYIQYPWTCKQCNHSGYEYGSISFDGHLVFSYVPMEAREDSHEES